MRKSSPNNVLNKPHLIVNTVTTYYVHHCNYNVYVHAEDEYKQMFCIVATIGYQTYVHCGCYNFQEEIKWLLHI